MRGLVVTATCTQADAVVRRWTATGLATTADLALLDEHLGGCTACRARLAALRELLARDAGAGRVALGDAPPGRPSPAVLEGVMRRVGGSHAIVPGRRVLPAPLLAAAALVLAVAGFLVFRATLGWAGRERLVVVRFELAAPEARTVALVGDFTEWGDGVLDLEDRDGDGLWTATVRLRPARSYSYNFVVDGEVWIVDPNAELNVEDGFGGMSSVIIL